MQQPTDRDDAWFRSIYARNAHLIHAYASRRADASVAEDIVNETFTTLWTHRDDAPDKTLAWLYRVASGHLAHHHRHRKRRQKLSEKLSNEAKAVGAAATELPESRLDDQITAILDSLKPPEVEILRLTYWEELNCEEIAVVLNCSPAAARQRLHRARERARTRFSPGYAGGDPANTSIAESNEADSDRRNHSLPTYGTDEISNSVGAEASGSQVHTNDQVPNPNRNPRPDIPATKQSTDELQERSVCS